MRFMSQTQDYSGIRPSLHKYISVILVLFKLAPDRFGDTGKMMKMTGMKKIALKRCQRMLKLDFGSVVTTDGVVAAVGVPI